MLRDERSARSAQAFAEAALLDWHQGRYTSAREAALQATAIARDCGARQELALALTIVGQVYTHLGETNHAEESFAEAAGILEESGDPDLRARSTRFRSWTRYMHGRFEESLELNRLGLEVARREGSDGRYGVHLLDIVLESLIELGRWSEARTVGDQILARLSISFEMVYTHVSLARMYTLLGRTADAEREIAQAAEMPAVGQHRVWQLEDSIFLAYATGRHADGRRDHGIGALGVTRTRSRRDPVVVASQGDRGRGRPCGCRAPPSSKRRSRRGRRRRTQIRRHLPAERPCRDRGRRSRSDGQGRAPQR